MGLQSLDRVLTKTITRGGKTYTLFHKSEKNDGILRGITMFFDHESGKFINGRMKEVSKGFVLKPNERIVTCQDLMNNTAYGFHDLPAKRLSLIESKKWAVKPESSTIQYFKDPVADGTVERLFNGDVKVLGDFWHRNLRDIGRIATNDLKANPMYNKEMDAYLRNSFKLPNGGITA